MSKVTEIQWADHTFNPWIGCTKVNDDCTNCYAEALDKQRFSKTLGEGTKEKPIIHWGRGKPRYRTSELNWQWVRNWNAAQRRKGAEAQRPRMFPSMCDWLDEEADIQWLIDFLHLIWATPDLDWLLLTKRPNSFFKRLLQARDEAVGVAWGSFINWLEEWLSGKEPPANVWILASAGNQKNLDAMLSALLKIPAKVRGLSIEPMTGPVDLHLEYEHTQEMADEAHKAYKEGKVAPIIVPGLVFRRTSIHWVIFGGESGADARPCNIQWIRDGVRQCRNAQVPCFVKQIGSNPEMNIGDSKQANSYPLSGPTHHPKGGDMEEWPVDLRVRQFPNIEHRTPNDQHRTPEVVV